MKEKIKRLLLIWILLAVGAALVLGFHLIREKTETNGKDCRFCPKKCHFEELK